MHPRSPRRPAAAWPLLLAANRDELRSRAGLATGPPLARPPTVRGGLDVEGGGTWLGLNDDGVVAAVLNRRGTLGPEPGKRSRGELVLEALDHAEATPRRGSAARPGSDRLAPVQPDRRRRGRRLLAAPRRRRADPGAADRADGLHMIEAGELDDPASARIARFLPQFRFVPQPDPAAGDWSGWEALLAERSARTGDPRDAMCIVTDGEYGTVSSALIALPRHVTEPPVYLHAEGRPGEVAFVEVAA